MKGPMKPMSGTKLILRPDQAKALFFHMRKLLNIQSPKYEGPFKEAPNGSWCSLT